jgi:hypothetical protein
MPHRSQNTRQSITTAISGWLCDSYAPLFIVLLVWASASLLAVAIIASVV